MMDDGLKKKLIEDLMEGEGGKVIWEGEWDVLFCGEVGYSIGGEIGWVWEDGEGSWDDLIYLKWGFWYWVVEDDGEIWLYNLMIF